MLSLRGTLPSRGSPAGHCQQIEVSAMIEASAMFLGELPLHSTMGEALLWATSVDKSWHRQAVIVWSCGGWCWGAAP